jgi:Family of unknown function (DUF5681)
MANDIENEVGYKNPPKAFRFKKGRSGNPSGRPRKVPGIPELLGKVAKQKVLTNGKNGPKHMTKLEASVTQITNKAASGDLKAAKLLFEIMNSCPPGVRQKDIETKASSAKAKLLALVEARYGSLAEGTEERDRRSGQ